MIYHFTGDNACVWHNGKSAGRLPTDIDTGENADFLILSENPLYPPYQLSVRSTDDGTVISPNTCSAVFYPNGDIEIELGTPPIRYAVPTLSATVVKAERATYRLLYGSFVTLEAETANTVDSFRLPDELTGARMKAEMLDGREMFALTGAVSSRPYLFAAVVDGAMGRVEKRIDSTGLKIEQDARTIRILSEPFDLARRAVVTEYSAETFLSVNRLTVYVSEPVHIHDLRLIPIAMFESVKARDFAEASTYLTDGLLDAMPIEQIETFLAPFVRITDRGYTSEPSYALIDRDNRASIFRFVLKNAKIDNIEEIPY